MIVRSPKPESFFYIVDKRLSEDSSLSWAARGLLIFLLGKPDNWSVSVEYLTTQSDLKRDGVRNLLAELIEKGYVVRHALRESGKIAGYSYTVFDSPQTPLPSPPLPSPPKPPLTSNEFKQVMNETKKNSASESLEEKAQVEKLKQGQFAKPDTFQITFEWKPSANFETRCKMAGKDFAKFNADILMSFINYNESREQYKTQKEWEGLLLTAFTRELAKPSVKPQSGYKQTTQVNNDPNAVSQPIHIVGQFDDAVKNRVSAETFKKNKAHLNSMLED